MKRKILKFVQFCLAAIMLMMATTGVQADPNATVKVHVTMTTDLQTQALLIVVETSEEVRAVNLPSPWQNLPGDFKNGVKQQGANFPTSPCRPTNGGNEQGVQGLPQANSEHDDGANPDGSSGINHDDGDATGNPCNDDQGDNNAGDLPDDGNNNGNAVNQNQANLQGAFNSVNDDGNQFVNQQVAQNLTSSNFTEQVTAFTTTVTSVGSLPSPYIASSAKTGPVSMAKTYTAKVEPAARTAPMSSVANFTFASSASATQAVTNQTYLHNEAGACYACKNYTVNFSEEITQAQG